MKSEHEPDLAFVENLEWQLKTAVRRHARFSEPASRRVRTLAQTAGLVLLSLFVGAAGAVAAGRLQRDERSQLLLTQNAIQLELAERRVSVASAAVDGARNGFEQGVVSKVGIWSATRRQLEERHALERLQLDRAEIQLTGERPAAAFTTPLVAGRDFVTERLALELSYARGRHQILQEEWEQAIRMSENGVLGPAPVDELEARVREVRGEIERLETHLVLRSHFLAGELSAEEAELRNLRVTLQIQKGLLRARHDLLTGRVQRERQLVKEGRAPESGLRELQLELDTLEGDIHLLELEARILDTELGVELPEVREEPAPGPGDRRLLEEMGYTR